MQKELEIIKKNVTERIRKLFLEKFDGNQRKFAAAAKCDEKTIRLLFQENSGMTLNLLFKIALALETTPSKLLEGMELDNVTAEKKK